MDPAARIEGAPFGSFQNGSRGQHRQPPGAQPFGRRSRARGSRPAAAGTGAAGPGVPVGRPACGPVHLEATDGTSTPANPAATVGNAVRDLTYMPNHAKQSYGSFDRRTWTAALGMGGGTWADADTGVEAEGLPSNLRVVLDAGGTFQGLDANSLLGVRFDFQTGSGCTKGVLVTGGLCHSTRSSPEPFGTKRQADQVTTVPNLSDVTVNLPGLAPPGWNGRVSISFHLQNGGPDVHVLASIRAA